MTSSRFVEALAWALIHFLWQGAAIALAAALAGAALRRARPHVRYGLYAAALGLMALAPVATILWGLPGRPAAPVLQPLPASALAVPAAVSAVLPARDSDWLPTLVLVWLTGVGICGVRAAGGFVLAQQMKRKQAEPAGPTLRRAAVRLAARLGLRRRVPVMISRAADVPVAIGWLRPVVLLPASALTALPPDQIAMILAHELAHIRRHDYLVNLGQIALETVLFYHPAVWWLSRRIRIEREHCCDDLAVRATGDLTAYARALAALDAFVASRPNVAMAANGAPLLARIERLARLGPERSPASAWLGAALAASIVAAAALTASWPEEAIAQDQRAPAPAKAPAAESNGLLGTLAKTGYADVSVDEIVALRDHGVDPAYIRSLQDVGLGRPAVRDLIRLHDHGVPGEFVRGVSRSGLVADLDVDNAIVMREHGVDPRDLAKIRELGFGPYGTGDVVLMRDRGISASNFEVLKELGITKAGVAEAIQIQDNGITLSRVREMKGQGWKSLTLEQVIKLARGGVI